MRGACPGSTEEGRCSGRVPWGVAAELGGEGGWSTHQPGKEAGKCPRGKVGGVGWGHETKELQGWPVFPFPCAGQRGEAWQDMIQMLDLLLRATGSY